MQLRRGRIGLWIEQACKHGRVRCGAHRHRFVVPADRNFRPGERIGSNVRVFADCFRYDNLAIEALRHVLESRGDIDGVAERGKYRVTAKADVANDDFPRHRDKAAAEGCAALAGSTSSPNKASTPSPTNWFG